ncbi:MmgE/PrpD family protein [Micromonospora sp. NPDC001898]|uniref:MmgE/PrpD family protein n=1 Tax=Micromonospora sp. NPDC001898 TaxID=3364221 RepID=UPI0036CDB7AC
MTEIGELDGPSLTETLVAEVRRPVDADTRRLAALHVLDWIATATAGLGTEEGGILTAFAASADHGPAWTIGYGERAESTAAFVNAGLALVLEMDATHRRARLHPGPVVIAAALAMAQRQGANGAGFLDAVVRGYEVMIRVGEATGPTHYRYFHPTSTCGAFGAAAAGASLLDLTERQWVDALGNAGSRTGGLWRCRLERTMSKLVHVGESAGAGLRAARLAHLGLTGPRHVLEGELGLFAASCPDADPEAVNRPGVSGWKITETSLKPWPGCRHAHPAVDAALRLRRHLVADGVPAGQIEEVEVLTYPEALGFTDQPRPASTPEALFSVQHLVAVALARGEPSLDDVGPPALRDPELAAIRARVRVASGEPYASAYPSSWGARVSVAYRGRWYREQVRDTRGDPESPMTAGEIEAKAGRLLDRAGLTGPEIAAGLATVASLPTAGGLGQLVAVLPGRSGPGRAGPGGPLL